MKTRHNILLIPLLVLMALLTVACSNDTANDETEPLPEGTGRIRITICTPEANPDLTRAVGSPAWENPDHSWELLHSFRILIFDSTYKLVDIIERTDPTMTTSTPDPSYQQSATVESDALIAGTYYVYATANYADGFVEGTQYTEADIINATAKFPNGYSTTNIPMTGKLASSVDVSTGVADAGTITVWRVVGKLEFAFTNETTTNVKIKGIEVDPINLGTTSSTGEGIYLFSKDDLTTTTNLTTGGIHLPTVETGPVSYTPATPLTLNETGVATADYKLFFYVNETDATYTSTQNQFSVRFKIARQKSGEEWYDDEIRYGLTTNYASGSGGFNVIRRNDWIHIPIKLRDWQFRIEPIAFVPIAGYPAVLLSSDALTATFSTGGYIILQPFAQKNNDGVWRNFFDPEVEFVSISWKNSDGTDKSGSDMIVLSPFTYDTVNKCITGELNNTLSAGTYKTTITVNVKLGPSGSQQDYSFTCNVVLQISST